jgi:peptidoglycan/xylan/chitin deacetylase (PgdA/CDA1 family)
LGIVLVGLSLSKYPYWDVKAEFFPQYGVNWGSSSPYAADNDRLWDGAAACMRRTSTGLNTATHTSDTISPALNITNATHIIVDYHVHDFVATTNTAEINQKLWNQWEIIIGDNTLSNKLTSPTFSRGYGQSDILFMWSQPGTHRAIIPIARCSESGTFDESAVAKMRIVWKAYNATPALTNADFDTSFMKITFAQLVDQPRIFVTHDDCKDDAYLFAEAAAARGIPITFYCIPGKLGTTDYISSSELAEIQAMGHLIGNHTYNHYARFNRDGTTDYGDPQLEGDCKYQVRKARDWLLDNGFERGAYLHATPWTDYDLHTLKWLTEGPDPLAHQVAIGYARHGGHYQGVNVTTGGDFLLDTENWPWWLDPQFPMRWPFDPAFYLAATGNFGTDKSHNDVVDACIANSCSACTFTHTEGTTLNTQLDYIQSKIESGDIRACTMDELAYGATLSGGTVFRDYRKYRHGINH